MISTILQCSKAAKHRRQLASVLKRLQHSATQPASDSSCAHTSHSPNSWPFDTQANNYHQLQQQQSAEAVTTAATAADMATSSAFPRTFYRRVLPCPPAIHFASDEGKQLLAAALADGTANAFFKLIEHFRTQDEPAFCGLASLAMVLNSLAIDPRRPWKGPWRMFHERMLDCCHPLSKVIEEGVTLTQVACLARCNGAAVKMWRHNEITLQDFRQQIEACSQSDQQYLIVSYCRTTFQQTGDGHFSPVGAYHRERNLVLILDTARFKYPPHWVPLELLYEAMAPLDPATQLPRGLLLVSHSQRPNSVLFTLDRRTSGYEEVNHFLTTYLQAAVTQHAQATTDSEDSTVALQQLLVDVLRNVPREAQEFLSCRMPEPHHEGCTQHAGSNCHPTTSIQQLLHELRAMELFKQLQKAASGAHDDSAIAELADAPFGLERAAMLLLMAEPDTWNALQDKPALQALPKMLQLAAGSNVAVEVDFVKQQLKEVPLLEHDSQLAAQCHTCAGGGCHACH